MATVNVYEAAVARLAMLGYTATDEDKPGLEYMIAKDGAKNGAAGVVMDPKSGAILAIAASPTYDVNAHREIYDSKLQEELAKVDEENPPAPDQAATAK